MSKRKYKKIEQKTINIPIEYKRLFDNDWRECACYGGRFSLKSHTVARYLLIQARSQKTRIACFREFQNSIGESSHQLLAELINHYEMKDFEITNSSIINKINGSDFLFKGLWNNEQSIKSIEGIDIAWVEEAQTVSTKSLEVLTPTVRKDKSKIIYTYNRLLEDDPVHNRLITEGRPNTLIINENYDIAIKYGMMPDVILNEIEDDKKLRPALYKHKWLGLPAGMERKIYTGWAIVDEIPHEAKLVSRGIDFGYSVDPTVIVDIYKFNGGYIFDERIYRKGMHNDEIANFLKTLPVTINIADSAEPKSIDEIRLFGLDIIGAQKGKGSVKRGIDFVQSQKCSITKTSTNVIRCYRKYMWKIDRNGIILNIPEHDFSDPMDAIRYGLSMFTADDTKDESDIFEQQAKQMMHNNDFLDLGNGKIAKRVEMEKNTVQFL